MFCILLVSGGAMNLLMTFVLNSDNLGYFSGEMYDKLKWMWIPVGIIYFIIVIISFLLLNSSDIYYRRKKIKLQNKDLLQLMLMNKSRTESGKNTMPKISNITPISNGNTNNDSLSNEYKNISLSSTNDDSIDMAKFQLDLTSVKQKPRKSRHKKQISDVEVMYNYDRNLHGSVYATPEPQKSDRKLPKLIDSLPPKMTDSNDTKNTAKLVHEISNKPRYNSMSKYSMKSHGTGKFWEDIIYLEYNTMNYNKGVTKEDPLNDTVTTQQSLNSDGNFMIFKDTKFYCLYVLFILNGIPLIFLLTEMKIFYKIFVKIDDDLLISQINSIGLGIYGIGSMICYYINIKCNYMVLCLLLLLSLSSFIMITDTKIEYNKLMYYNLWYFLLMLFNGSIFGLFLNIITKIYGIYNFIKSCIVLYSGYIPSALIGTIIIIKMKDIDNILSNDINNTIFICFLMCLAQSFSVILLCSFSNVSCNKKSY